MRDLEALLRDAIGDIATTDTSVDLRGRVSRRGRQRRIRRAVAGVVVVAAIAGGAVAIANSDDSRSVRGVGEGERSLDVPVFSTPTDVVLLFDDGYDGVTALDLDAGVVGWRVLDGQRAGDQPFRLFRAGDSLIVGWGDVFAAPLSGQASVLLGDATIALPAVEDEAAWLATWTAGRIGQGELTLRLVDTDGRTLVEGAGPPSEELPVLGVSGGVAVNSSSGLVLWDVATQTATTTLPGGHALAATSDQVIWCEGACDSLLVRELATGDDTRIELPEGVGGLDTNPSSAAVSPDGSMLAILGAGAHILVVDLAAGTASVVAERAEPNSAARWSPDGHFVLWAGSSEGVSTEVGRVEVETGLVEARRLALPGAFRVVAVERNAAQSFLPSELGSSTACRRPADQTSERVGVCGFRVG